MFFSCVGPRSVTFRSSRWPHLPIGVLRKTDRTRLGDTFQSCRDIDAVAHQVAVALFDYVAQMYADPKLDAALGRQAGVALDQAVLQFDGAAHRVDHASEFDDRAVAGVLHDVAAMGGDGRVEQVAAQPSQPRQRSVLVDGRKPRIADHIGDKDRRQLPCLNHGASRLAQDRRSPSGAKAIVLERCL